MFEYTPSNVFWADQGLPNDTEIDLNHETEYMYEFIALIVGEPISLWDLYKEYVKNPSRQFYARVKIDGIEFDDENIVEITLDETVNPDDSLTLGSVASSKLDITVYDIHGTNYTDATVTAEIGLEIEGDIAYVPLGVFTVDSVDKNNNRINLTCFDNMVKMERPYVSNLSYPASLNQVALEIAQQAGVNLVTTLPNIFVDEIKGYTLRQAIGFVASFVGCFAKFNRDGDLEIISYRETDEMITADNYMDLQTQENEFVVGRITCKVSNDDGDFEFVAGVGGTGIYFENPIMTQEQLDNLWDELKFLTYMPFDMRWQGNPLLMAGDKIQITDINNQIYSTLVMDQQLRYAGGLSATTSAKGKSETAQEFDFKGSLTERVERIEKQQQESDPNKTPEKPSNITATGLFENIIVEWAFENARYINSYEVYASKTPNFVPNESNLVWLGKSGSFVFYAQPNETWYFKVRGINTHGVPGPFSDEASATTALIDGEYIEDATIGMAKIRDINADSIIAGVIRGIEIIGSTITSFNTATNNVVTLENGEITTFEDGKQRFGIYGNGLVAYHWITEEQVATFRASHINNERFGAGIVGYGDYFNVGRHIGGGIARNQLSFYWDGDYDRVNLYGGTGLKNSGRLELRANQYGTNMAGKRTSSISLRRYDSDGTDWSGVFVHVGRDDKSPSSANMRSGFEIWQYQGDNDGTSHTMLVVDTNSSGTKYINAYVDTFWVDGEIQSTAGLNLYGSGASGNSRGIQLRPYQTGAEHIITSHTSGGELTIYPQRWAGRDRFRIRSHSSRTDYVDDLVISNSGYLLTRLQVKSPSFIITDGTPGDSVTNDRVRMRYVSSNFVISTRDSSNTYWKRIEVEGRGVSGATNNTTHIWDRIRSQGTRDNTVTWSARVAMSDSGYMGFVSSSERFKLIIEDVDVDPYLIHKLNVKSWYDRINAERYAELLSKKEKGEKVSFEEIEKIERIPGLIAEEVHDAGLTLFVNYDNEGRPEGIDETRLWMLLIPISRDHEARLNEYDKSFGKIESRIERLERGLEKLKGVT